NSEGEILATFPITIVTAIVSPIARPKASTMAAIIPVRANGKTAVLMVSQPVAPRAVQASRWLRGTAVITSRITDDPYGIIIIASMIPVVNIPRPLVGPWKNG